ncbi:hypothetical protein M408DRAFT_29824 [Serendipita vermifera MAFF 305830]|uniref:RanBD1 domain-containing protein n=1 Tax=Serendipita vermifera MAFF 305830 TaxID=933852 RepID=A0A0C3AM83_SERVB|nr:hypothetical protein M408DRAFT_29824 [Serendipita vermifera MAFF 305830]
MKRSAESQLTRENLDTEEDSASTSTATLPSLGPVKLPSLSASTFSFKPSATQGASPFALPTGGASKSASTGFSFGAPGASATSTTSGSGFSFKLPTPAAKDAESSANGTKTSGGLPPFNPSTSSSSSSLPPFGSLPSATAKESSKPTKSSAPTFSFGAPPSSKPSADATAKPSGAPASNPAAPSKPSSAPAGGKASTQTPAMTATAKSMSSIFSSMTSESPPRPTLPGFKGANGGITVSPEKGAAPASGKAKAGSFSFGGGVPKKPTPGEAAQSKPKSDKGKGKATTSTGTFGLGKSQPASSPIEEESDDSQGPYDPKSAFPNGPNSDSSSERSRLGQLPGGLDAGDFDPALDEDGQPTRKPYYDTEHQEAYEHDPELKYWFHLRGLNTSFLREVIRMQREDAFMDMSGIFKSYKEFRKGIIGEMVEYLRANGKGDGTESAGEESNSEDEDMYYDEAENEEVHMEGTEDDSAAAHADEPDIVEVDKEKTPPAGPQAPAAPPGGLYVFGGKPISSFAGVTVTGGGFMPTGAAAEYKPPPPARYTFRNKEAAPAPNSAPTGFTPTVAPSTGAKEPSKSGFAFGSAPLPAPTGPTLSFTPAADGSSGTSAPPKPAGFGFTPTFGSLSPTFGNLGTALTHAPAPPLLSGSGFSFKPPTSGGFSFSAPAASNTSASSDKESSSQPRSQPEVTPSKTSTFPGFGPITGGPSGSPFGTKASPGDNSASSSSSSGFGFRPSGESTSGSDGKQGESAFGPGTSGSTADITKTSAPFGSKSAFSWPPSNPEPAKPGGLFGAPPASASPPLFGSASSTSSQPGSIFGAKPPTNPAPAFGSGFTFGGAAPSTSAFGTSASTNTSAFGAGGTKSAFSFPPVSSGDPAKGYGSEGTGSGKSGDEKDELEGDEDQNTTPKANAKDLPPASEPGRVGIANPWAKATATTSIAPAPAPGGPFTFGMGSRPAAPEITPSKPSGFSFADPPPSTFKLPSAGSFSFADPPKAAGGPSAFANPFASPPKVGILPGFGGFGGMGAAGGPGSNSAPAPPPLFGGGTFSFGTPSTLAKGPFLSSGAGTTSKEATAGGSGGPASESTSTAGTSQESSTGAGASQDSDVAPETGLALGEDKFDQPGPGEEMEENLYNVRGKVLKFVENKWVDLGIGQIRLYKHKETGAKRVFARNSKSGRILLNFAPFSKMEPKVDDQNHKFMRMTGMDEGKLMKILVKLKEKSDAAELVGVLQKEVEALS